MVRIDREGAADEGTRRPFEDTRRMDGYLMIGRRQRRQRQYRGQGIVEMALLTPLLMLILLGALDLGRAYIYATRLNNAVKEGAMIGLYQPDLISVKKRAFREVTDPGLLADTSDDHYLLGVPDRDFVIDSLKRYRASAPTTAIDCIADPAACTSPGPGDAIEVGGYYIFQPFTTQIVRILPPNFKIRQTVRAVY